VPRKVKRKQALSCVNSVLGNIAFESDADFDSTTLKIGQDILRCRLLLRKGFMLNTTQSNQRYPITYRNTTVALPTSTPWTIIIKIGPLNKTCIDPIALDPTLFSDSTMITVVG